MPPPLPHTPVATPQPSPPQGRRASDPATATDPLPARPKSLTIPPTHPHEEDRAQPTLPTHRHSREGGNPGWGAALRSPSPTPRHPATLPPHGRRASDPRRRESRVGRGPAQPITYPPPPRNPPPTWPSRQRPAKAGIQGGARPCAAHHLPPATPQPSPTKPSGWGAALRSPSPTPRHPATLPPHGASDPRKRESRVGRGPAQPITYPPPPRNPPPTWPSRQRPAKAGIQGGGRLALPPQSRRAATRVKPHRRCQGGLPPKNNQRAKPCRSYRESPPSKQSTLCVPSRFRRRKKKDRLSTEL